MTRLRKKYPPKQSIRQRNMLIVHDNADSKNAAGDKHVVRLIRNENQSSSIKKETTATSPSSSILQPLLSHTSSASSMSGASSGVKLPTTNATGLISLPVTFTASPGLVASTSDSLVLNRKPSIVITGSKVLLREPIDTNSNSLMDVIENRAIASSVEMGSSGKNDMKQSAWVDSYHDKQFSANNRSFLHRKPYRQTMEGHHFGFSATIPSSRPQASISYSSSTINAITSILPKKYSNRYLI
ncbi:hypothetical protein V1511DRAFT_510871 [Dipodascopsis uninucleata]